MTVQFCLFLKRVYCVHVLLGKIRIGMPMRLRALFADGFLVPTAFCRTECWRTLFHTRPTRSICRRLFVPVGQSVGAPSFTLGLHGHRQGKINNLHEISGSNFVPTLHCSN